jgi:hypothetical protein
MDIMIRVKGIVLRSCGVLRYEVPIWITSRRSAGRVAKVFILLKRIMFLFVSKVCAGDIQPGNLAHDQSFPPPFGRCFLDSSRV